jgi:hypothetical protein
MQDGGSRWPGARALPAVGFKPTDQPLAVVVSGNGRPESGKILIVQELHDAAAWDGYQSPLPGFICGVEAERERDG